MKAHIRRPAPSLPGLVANDNTAVTIVRDLWPTMSVPEQAWVRAMLSDEATARMQEATLDEVIDRQPAAVLRSVRDRKMTGARLRGRELGERNACYRALAALLPPQHSGYARDRAIIDLMKRYHITHWRYEQGRAVAPEDQIGWLMHRILTLDKGTIRSRGTIVRAIAGARPKSWL